MITAKDIYVSFSHLSSLSVLIPIILCLTKYSAFNNQLKALFFYLLVNLINDIICFILFSNKFSTTLFFEIFTIFEGLIILYIYAKQFNLSTKVILIYEAALLGLLVIIYIVPGIPSDFGSASVAILLCSLGVIYFNKVFNELQIPILTNYYFFWLNTAFLFYFGTTFLLSLFENFIRSSAETVSIFLWSIQLACNIIQNFLLSIGIWKIQKK